MKPLFGKPDPSAPTPLELQQIEFESGLDEEIEGWLALTYPDAFAHLEKSRAGANADQHRKVCLKLRHRFDQEHPDGLEWTGSSLGPLMIVAGEAVGPRQISLTELEAAAKGTDEQMKLSLEALMRVKRAMGGGKLLKLVPL